MAETEKNKVSRSRRKVSTGQVLASDMSGISANYCRKCQRMLPETSFYNASDSLLDSNGKMSVCKSCCSDLYDKFYSSEGTLEKSVFKLCKILNVVYSEEVIEKLKKHLDSSISRGRTIKNPFGIYMSKVFSKLDNNILPELTFNDTYYSNSSEYSKNDSDMGEYEGIDIDEINMLKKKWGWKYEVEDLVFLEEQLSQWQDKHKHDTKAEETLLEDLCHLELKIRKSREEGASTASLIKEKQDLMKTASVDPAKANSLSSGTDKQLFSEFIAEIEKYEPAEFYEKRKKFKDWDKIGWYMNNFFIRAVKNFITQSRDFNIAESEKDEDLFDGSISDYVINQED